MLTNDDIEMLSALIDEKNKDQLSQIKVLVRQEVEAEIKEFRREQVLKRIDFDGEFLELEDKVKDIQITSNTIERNLDIKIEAFHHKLNTRINNLQENINANHKEMVECIQEVLAVVGELNTKLVARVDRIEKHLSLSDG